MLWLRRWFRTTPTARPKVRVRPNSFRPGIEAFEDRLVMSNSPVMEAPLAEMVHAAKAKVAPKPTLSQRIVNFATKNLNKQVGNGTCASFVKGAFNAAGAKTFLPSLGNIEPGDLSALAHIVGNQNTQLAFAGATFEINGKVVAINGNWVVNSIDGSVVDMQEIGKSKTMQLDLSAMKEGQVGVFDENYKWGTLIGVATPDNVSPIMSVRPGDALQYRDVVFTRNNNSDGEYTFRHHSAIVTAVNAAAGTITVHEQHVNGIAKVKVRILNVESMTAGTIWAYRPVDKAAKPKPKPPVPAPEPPKKDPDKVSRVELGYFWDVIALTKNSLQAPWLAREYGTGEDAEALGHKAEGIGKYAAAWGKIIAARALIAAADKLFEMARDTPAPEQGKLVDQGNAMLAEAKPMVKHSETVWAELWSATFVRA